MVNAKWKKETGNCERNPQRFCNFKFTLLRRKPRVFRPWMDAGRVPFEAQKERSRVCFGGFRPTKLVEEPRVLAHGAPHFALCNAVQQLLFMAELLFPPHQERFKYLEEIHSNESSGPLQFPFLADGGHAIGMKGLKSV